MPKMTILEKKSHDLMSGVRKSTVEEAENLENLVDGQRVLVVTGTNELNSTYEYVPNMPNPPSSSITGVIVVKAGGYLVLTDSQTPEISREELDKLKLTGLANDQIYFLEDTREVVYVKNGEIVSISSSVATDIQIDELKIRAMAIEADLANVKEKIHSQHEEFNKRLSVLEGTQWQDSDDTTNTSTEPDDSNVPDNSDVVHEAYSWVNGVPGIYYNSDIHHDVEGFTKMISAEGTMAIFVEKNASTSSYTSNQIKSNPSLIGSDPYKIIPTNQFMSAVGTSGFISQTNFSNPNLDIDWTKEGVDSGQMNPFMSYILSGTKFVRSEYMDQERYTSCKIRRVYAGKDVLMGDAMPPEDYPEKSSDEPTIAIDEDGNTIIHEHTAPIAPEEPQGEPTAVLYPDGTQVLTYPDGTVVTTHPDGTTTTITLADGGKQAAPEIPEQPEPELMPQSD